MKKIIGGKMYDTETAKALGCASATCSTRDFNYWEETLYIKKTGEYFLYGDGGPASRYAEPVDGQGHQWTGGCRISPLKFDQAREWAEKHLSVEEYEEIFGEVSEDDSRASLNLSMASSVVERAKRIAQERGVTVSVLISALIEREVSA